MEELFNKMLLKLGQIIKDIVGTQNIFNHRVQMCTLAAQGKWSKEIESK